ncbi:hypothetical protein SAMN05660662_1613 [Blastococcus aurantiacus]|uniref:Uncharacterized protein n=1 Tax=Blastococcus aurantiacus TaxID=1550231 RepID=A0A1G7JN84_9ACTN|nr:hypothetical protein [Blastococcus aurantiacus]SDF26373.1 hypothetical protein SAMN05660662_1613 [Blastococcus aurantiacus]
MSTDVVTVLAAAEQELPEDIGKAGPLGLLLIVVLLIAVALLVKSMAGHLKKVPRSFDPHDAVPEVPDTPAELVDPAPGEELLDSLRRRPLAIEPPRNDGSRPEGPAAQG